MSCVWAVTSITIWFPGASPGIANKDGDRYCGGMTNKGGHIWGWNNVFSVGIVVLFSYNGNGVFFCAHCACVMQLKLLNFFITIKKHGEFLRFMTCKKV